MGAVFLCALAHAASADNKEAAKQAYTEGKRQYDVGDYAAALDAFKKAYFNYEEPVFLFNIAQCYRALGDKPSAVRTYRAFLRNWPKAPNREQVERIIAQLDAAIAEDASAQAAPPPGTLPPQKPAEATPAKPDTAQAEAQPKPTTTPPSTTAPATPSSSEPKPQVAKKPTTPPPPEELAGMVEVVPNFDRPSGSAKPLKWWGWTLLALGVGGLVAAGVIIGITQSQPKFDTTLPTVSVNNGALHALTVRF